MSKYKIEKIKSFRMNRDDMTLIVVDVQERLLPAMKDADKLEASIIKLIQGIRTLDVPVVVTQQYTKGLGPTTTPVAQALGDFAPVEKTFFSAAEEIDFLEALNETKSTSVLLCGIEAHVCVAQTALILLELGYDVFVVEDGISSRSGSDKKTAMKRMIQAGARPVTVEAALFELLETANAPEFKEISRIVK